MIEVIISLIYIIAVVFGVGALGMSLLGRAFWRNLAGRGTFSIMGCLLAGITIITVYTEYLSIFIKIGAIAHIGMLLMATAGYYLERTQIGKMLLDVKKIALSWEGFFYLCVLILIAFFASRGTFHTDTNIYHAASIRIYEEYGVVKGIGNLQSHYAYNSAYFAFAAIFSLNWLLGHSVHTTTAFLEFISCVYAFYQLRRFKEHGYHMTDLSCAAILLGVLTILSGSMSPASDYATMLLLLLVISLWFRNMEGSRNIYIYGLLSVAGVFIVTVKFSAAFIVLLAIYPAVLLIKERRGKDILIFVGLGLLSLIPFLVRNFLISGWLLYPFAGIDIFNVEWKMPYEFLKNDADQIETWGKCLYDVSKVDAPLSEWLPVWWAEKDRHQMMLLYGVLVGIVFALVQCVKLFIQKASIKWEYLLFVVSDIACLLVWFFMSPFIRYGRAFIFAIKFIPVGVHLSFRHKGLYSIVGGFLVFLLFTCTVPYYSNYILESCVFVKQNLTEPYYLSQKRYDDAETGSREINGVTVYYSMSSDEINSYYYFPNTCYDDMLDRCTLIGDSVKDGFKAK